MIVFRVSTTEKPLPNPKAPPHPSPRGGRSTQPPKTQQEWAPSPWGGPGRGFRRAREGALQISCFCTGASRTFFTANGGFFYRGYCWRHARMTVGMAPMPRRKTCFPTGIGDIPTKAKPPAVPTAFCDYFSPVWVEQIKAHSGMPTSSGNSVGVAFPQPRVAGEARYPG